MASPPPPGHRDAGPLTWTTHDFRVGSVVAAPRTRRYRKAHSDAQAVRQAGGAPHYQRREVAGLCVPGRGSRRAGLTPGLSAPPERETAADAPMRSALAQDTLAATGVRRAKGSFAWGRPRGVEVEYRSTRHGTVADRRESPADPVSKVDIRPNRKSPSDGQEDLRDPDGRRHRHRTVTSSTGGYHH